MKQNRYEGGNMQGWCSCNKGCNITADENNYRENNCKEDNYNKNYCKEDNCKEKSYNDNNYNKKYCKEDNCKNEKKNCCNNMSNGCSCKRMTQKCECDMQERSPLAMAYIPDQEFRDIYPLSEALCKGTLFAELYMPFHGRFRI